MQPAARGVVHVAQAGPLVTLTLDSPGRLNAVSVAMWRQLQGACQRIGADPAVHCVVVRGAAGNFAAGADIEEFASRRHDEPSGRRYHLEVLAPALAALAGLPQPTVAAIEGVCVGGGLEIALACDLQLARQGARLGAPVGRLGFPLALPELAPLVERVGAAVAAELLLAGRLLDAEEAARKGLVQRAVSGDDFEAALAALIEGVLAGSPLAARLNKQQIRRVQVRGAPLTDAQIAASFSFFRSNDYREGIAAFLDKRQPRFTGD